jgi:hypothetical protein
MIMKAISSLLSKDNKSSWQNLIFKGSKTIACRNSLRLDRTYHQLRRKHRLQWISNKLSKTANLLILTYTSKNLLLQRITSLIDRTLFRRLQLVFKCNLLLQLNLKSLKSSRTHLLNLRKRRQVDTLEMNRKHSVNCQWNHQRANWILVKSVLLN